MKTTKNSHGSWDLTYHMVFVTKYRRKVLTGVVRETAMRECVKLIESMDGSVIEIETDEDHIHILAELTPMKAISQQVNVVKGVTSRVIRRDHMDLIRDKLCSNSFWGDGYYIGTAGGVTIEQIRKYVESQPTEEHKRKYERSGKYSKKKKVG